MVEHVYPGVYVTEVATAPHPIPGVPTSTPDIGPETIAIIQRLIRRLSPEWTGGNSHDPGITLLELAAWIAEGVAFRAGPVPDTAAAAATRLAQAALALASNRRQADGPAIARIRFFEGQLLDEKDLSTEVEYRRCLTIVRSRSRKNPVDGFRYQMLVDGVLVAGFDEIDGLTGGSGFFDALLRQLRKLLGLRKFTNIVLKRGQVADRTLADWHRNSQSSRADRRTVVIRRSEPSSRGEWHVSGAWIVKVEGPALNASANEVAIESIELAHEGLRIVCP